jgi:hypothetical protein
MVSSWLMLRVALAVLAVTSGCLLKPDKPTGDGGPGSSGDGGPVGSGHDAPPGMVTCTPLALTDGAGCGVSTFSADSSLTSTVSGGHVRIAPPANVVGSHAGCTATDYDLHAGLFIEVVSVLTTANTYTSIEVYTANHNAGLEIQPPDLKMSDENGTVIGSVITYGTDTRWLRIVAASDHALAGEYSADGVVWHRIGVRDVGADSIVTGTTVGFGAGMFAGTSSPNPGTAEVAAFGTCP